MCVCVCVGVFDDFDEGFTFQKKKKKAFVHRMLQKLVIGKGLTG